MNDNLSPATAAPGHTTTSTDVDMFVDLIRAEVVTPAVTEQHTPVGGYQWTWVQRGVWTLYAGGILNPGVILTGPAGTWQCGSDSVRAADLVLVLLQLANAMPARPETAGHVYGTPTGLPVPALAGSDLPARGAGVVEPGEPAYPQRVGRRLNQIAERPGTPYGNGGQLAMSSPAGLASGHPRPGFSVVEQDRKA